jgi:hypothetical protein
VRSRPAATCSMRSEATSAGLMHQFHEVAFEENLSLGQLTGVFAGARISEQKLYLPIESHWRHLRISVRSDGDLRRTAGTHGLQKCREKNRTRRQLC